MTEEQLRKFADRVGFPFIGMEREVKRVVGCSEDQKDKL